MLKASQRGIKSSLKNAMTLSSIVSIVLLVSDAMTWTSTHFKNDMTVGSMLASLSIIITLSIYGAVEKEVNLNSQSPVANTDDAPADWKLVTHAGQFHADDVFSTALLALIATKENKTISIDRVNNATDIPKDATIIYDIGGGEFDHHQVRTDTHQNTELTPYASFGLLWKKYGLELIKSMDISLGEETEQLIFEKFEKSLVIPIDAADNGIFHDDFSVSDMIADMNPMDDHDIDVDKSSFKEAMSDALQIILLRLSHLIAHEADKQIIAIGSEFVTPEIAVLPKHGPWSGLALENSQLKLVIYKSNRGGWNINTVSDRDENDERIDRFVIPQTINQMPGFVFVHKAGFIAAFDSKENAINAAKSILESKQGV